MITIDSLRNAYARSFKKGGRVRYGADGFRIPFGVTADYAYEMAMRYINQHPELSEEDKDAILADVAGYAESPMGTAAGNIANIDMDQVAAAAAEPRDTSSTGSRATSRDTVSTVAPVGQSGGLPDQLSPNTQDIHVIADGRAGRVVSPQLPEIEYEEPEFEEPEVPTNPNLYGNYSTPLELRDAAMSGVNLNVNYMHPENKAMLDSAKKAFLLSPEGKAWKAQRAQRAQEAQAYGLDQATRAKYRYGMEQEEKDREYWENQKKEAEDWLNSDEGKNAFAIDLDSYIKPVEEEDIGNEGVTDYNDFYNNASRKEIRGVAHGKGWTNANGEELLWTGDNRKQNRQYERSVRQGRRQDIRNIRNGKPKSEEYRYAPRFERNGGAMMRTFIGAMRRGGRL